MAIIDKIQLSGTVYTIGNETTTAVTSASTDNEIPTAKAVYDAIPQGGSSYTGVSGITINENNEIYYKNFVKTWLTSNHDDRYAVFWFQGSDSKVWIDGNSPEGRMNWLRSQFSFGLNQLNNSIGGFTLGTNNNINGFNAGGLGNGNTVNGSYSLGVNYQNKTNNSSEFASGQFNNSVKASTTFGNSGNTLFSVGNGTADNARHNAFEIKQNGDIYLTKDGQDVKLQDQLGGGGGSTYTAGDGIDITNDVISVTGKVDTSTYNTYTAATATAIGDKLAVSDFNTYSGTIDTVINSKASQSDLSTLSGTVTAHTANTDIHVTTAQTAAWNAKSDFSGDYNDLSNKLSAGTGISIVDNVISATGGGGGKAVTGGTNISVTTGETADTINCTLPITATTDTTNKAIIIGQSITATNTSNGCVIIGSGAKGSLYDVIIGRNAKNDSNGWNEVVAIGNQAKGYSQSVSIGSYTETYNGYRAGNVAIGYYAKAKNMKNAVAIGNEVSTTGTTKTNINNQLKIDASNQVYISNSANTSTYCLQEKIENTESALGGLKLVKLTQAQYDALATKDSNVLYVIVG